MSEVEQLKMELAQVKRERDQAISAINLYRLTLQWVYKQYPDMPPIIKASILSDLQSYLNGPMIAEMRAHFVQLDEPDSFDRHIFVEQADKPVDLETLWDNFIYCYAIKYGFFVKDKKGIPLDNPPNITLKNFIGSTESYKKEFLEANK